MRCSWLKATSRTQFELLTACAGAVWCSHEPAHISGRRPSGRNSYLMVICNLENFSMSIIRKPINRAHKETVFLCWEALAEFFDIGKLSPKPGKPAGRWSVCVSDEAPRNWPKFAYQIRGHTDAAGVEWPSLDYRVTPRSKWKLAPYIIRSSLRKLGLVPDDAYGIRLEEVAPLADGSQRWIWLERT